MTLQASGTITAAQINSELGRVSNSTLELQQAAAGQYAFINEISASRPSISPPFHYSHWYGYNHNAVRAINLMPGSPSNGLVTYYTNRYEIFYYNASLKPGEYSKLYRNPDTMLPAPPNSYYYDTSNYYIVQDIGGEFGVITGTGGTASGPTYAVQIWESYGSTSAQACSKSEIGPGYTSYQSSADLKHYTSPSGSTTIPDRYYTRIQGGLYEIIQMSGGVVVSSGSYC